MKVTQIDPRKGPLGHNEALTEAKMRLAKIFPKHRYKVVCLVLFDDPEDKDASYMNVLATTPMEDEVMGLIRVLLDAYDD